MPISRSGALVLHGIAGTSFLMSILLRSHERRGCCSLV